MNWFKRKYWQFKGVDFELYRRWIRALRSGEFKQGRNALQNLSGGFCCLGVACAVSAEHGHNLSRYEVIQLAGDPGLIVNGGLQRRLGFDSWMFPLNQGELANMNDVDKKSFDQIADYIEEKVFG